MAAPDVQRLSSSHYPGAPFSFHYLDTPWGTEPADRHNGFGHSGAWGRSGKSSWEEERQDSWSAPGRSSGPVFKHYMSRNHDAQGPSDTTSQRDQSGEQSYSNVSRPPSAEGSGLRPLQPAQIQMYPSEAEGQATYPPRSSAPSQQSTDVPSAAPNRPLGMRNILNPAQADDLSQSDPAARTDLETPSTAEASLSGAGTARSLPTLSPRILKRLSRPSPPPKASSAATPGSRRVLTPRSPRLRTVSLAGRRSPAPSLGAPPPVLGTYEGQSRIYTAEPGTNAEADIPPLPATSNAGRLATGYTVTSEAGRSDSRRASGGRGVGLVAGSVAASQSDSPSTSHSSYSHFSQTSPVVGYATGPNQPGQYSYPRSTQPSGPSQSGYPASSVEGHYDVGTGSYQMTLDTESGPMIVPVEVDVQHASKMADEKRKRNAGASARFRARRKEKEKEANTTIDALQKAIRDITEEKEFYQGERNFFRDFVLQRMGPSSFPRRPISPRDRRLLPPPPSSRMQAEGSTSQWRTSSREGTESPTRSQRRRTGDYQPSFPRPPLTSPMITPQAPAYGAQFPPPPPPPSLQPSLLDPREPGPPPPPPPTSQAPPPPPRSMSYDPFRPNTYDRSWNPAR